MQIMSNITGSNLYITYSTGFHLHWPLHHVVSVMMCVYTCSAVRIQFHFCLSQMHHYGWSALPQYTITRVERKDGLSECQHGKVNVYRKYPTQGSITNQHNIVFLKGPVQMTDCTGILPEGIPNIFFHLTHFSIKEQGLKCSSNYLISDFSKLPGLFFRSV